MNLEMKGASEVYHLNVGRTRRISSLSIQGAHYFSESDLRTELGVAEKAVFDQQTLIEAGDRIRRMYMERGFRNTVIDLEFARMSPTEVNVTMKIKEGPQSRIRNIELKAANPEFRQQFERFLINKLEDEPLNDQILNNLRKDARERFSKKGYLKAELVGPQVNFNSDESRADLSFSVANTDQYFIEFKGVTRKGLGTLKDALELDQFYSPNPNIGPELATRLKNYYLKEGFARVEVSGEEATMRQAYQKAVILNVKEGPLVKIKDIQLIGVQAAPEKYYVEFLKDHSSELIQDGYYNREDFETGLKNLVIDRQNQGYLRAKVISTKTTYTGEKKDEIVITVNLDEGPRTLLQDLSFEGNNSISSEQLAKLLGFQANEPLRLNKLEEGIGKLKEFYQNSGFLEMRLTNEREDLVRYNSDSTQASVHFKINEGPKIQVASILIEGNSITKDSVILKELEFKEGDVLTPHLIEESTRRLQRLGHFNSVSIKTLEEKTQIQQRTVVIRVLDRDPGLFTMGAGVNSELGITVRGYIGIAYRNILGTGRGASARAEGNYNIDKVKFLERKVTLGYLEPYLFDTRVKGRINYTLAEYVSNYEARQGTQLKQISYTLEQAVTSNLITSYDLWNSSQIRTFPLDEDNEKIERTEVVIVSTGPTVDFDYRDHPFNPTKGSFTRVNLEYSSPRLGSSREVDYIRTYGNFTHYHSLRRAGWVWANSLRGGYIRNYSREGGVPYDLKGFTLGGQTTIRGFQPDEAFPNEHEFFPDPADKDKTTRDYPLTTSASMYLLKSEIRFPLFGPVGAAAFYDGGAVFVESLGFSDPYRDAVGIGLRYATPLGPVSLDLGYKLDLKEERNESQWPIYFSIGTF